MLEFNWNRDVPYSKGKEIEKGSFVYDVVDYFNSPFPSSWSHLRIVRRENNEIQFQDIPKSDNPSNVPYEERFITIFNKNFSGEKYTQLDNFLKKCGCKN